MPDTKMKTANSAALALLLCLATMAGTISCAGGASIRDDLALLADILEPEVDFYEDHSMDPRVRENVAIARGVIVLLRTGAEPGVSIGQVRELKPVFVGWLQSRGMSEAQIEAILRPIRVALVILESRLSRLSENRPQ